MAIVLFITYIYAVLPLRFRKKSLTTKARRPGVDYNWQSAYDIIGVYSSGRAVATDGAK